MRKFFQGLLADTFHLRVSVCPDACCQSMTRRVVYNLFSPPSFDIELDVLCKPPWAVTSPMCLWAYHPVWWLQQPRTANSAQTDHKSCDCPHHGWNFESCVLVSGGPQTVLTIRDPRPESNVLQLFSKFTKYVNDKISCAKVLIKSICVQVLRLYKAYLQG